MRGVPRAVTSAAASQTLDDALGFAALAALRAPPRYEALTQPVVAVGRESDAANLALDRRALHAELARVAALADVAARAAAAARPARTIARLTAGIDGRARARACDAGLRAVRERRADIAAALRRHPALLRDGSADVGARWGVPRAPRRGTARRARCVARIRAARAEDAKNDQEPERRNATVHGVPLHCNLQSRGP